MILSTCCCNSLLQHHCAEQKLCSLNRCSTGAIAFATKCLKSPVRFWWIYNEVYFLIRKASIVLILFLSFVLLALAKIPLSMTFILCPGSAKNFGSGISRGSFALFPSCCMFARIVVSSSVTIWLICAFFVVDVWISQSMAKANAHSIDPDDPV